MRRFRFIINPVSASRHPGIEDLIRQESTAAGFTTEIIPTAHAGHATELAREAAKNGVDLVVAVGGDGTVNEVANGLVGSETALGIVPIGTGNALARSLGIPVDAARACQLLSDAQISRIDVGQIGSRYFLSTMGVGVDAEVCRLFSGTPADKRSLLRYAWLTTRAVWAYVPEHLTIDVDGHPWLRGTPLLATVANTAQYGHGATIAPGAVPTDGLLDLCILDPPSLFAAVRNARRLFTGTIDRMPGYQRVPVTHVRITRPRPGCYQADGESLDGDAILDISVVPASLCIALPARA